MKRFLALNTVALAALFAGVVAPGTANGGGGCRGFEVTAAEGSNVDMTDELCFLPTVLHVDPGTEVTWTNTGTAPHAVAGANTSWGSYEEIGEGESMRFTFDSAGTYSYYCFLHNGMIGTIVVGDGGNADGAVAGDAEGGQDDSGRWSLAMVGALTGMIATGAAGLAFGRRANR